MSVLHNFPRVTRNYSAFHFIEMLVEKRSANSLSVTISSIAYQRHHYNITSIPKDTLGVLFLILRRNNVAMTYFLSSVPPPLSARPLCRCCWLNATRCRKRKVIHPARVSQKLSFCITASETSVFPFYLLKTSE